MRDAPMVPNVKLNAKDGKVFGNPKQYIRMVGKLNYLAITLPSIAFRVSVVSKFMSTH